MPTERMGPPPGALPPMRMTASWLGPEVDLPNTSLWRQKMPQWRAPLGSRSYAKAPVAVHHRSACSGVKALRNTSVAKRQAAKLWLAFRSLDLFRALREPDRRRRDEERPFRSEQKTATNQNDYLTGTPHTSHGRRFGVFIELPLLPDHHRLVRCATPPTLSAADTGPRGAGIYRADGPWSRREHWRPATCSAGQEIRDQPRELRRLLHLWHVTAVLDDDKPRARDGTLIDLATIDRRDRVLASPHEQCRRADARQEMSQRQAVHIGLPCDPAGHLAVLLDEIGLLRRPLVPPVAHELRRLLGLMEGAPQSRQSRLQEIVEDLALLGLDAHCADEDHLVEERRRHGRDLGGRPPAERAADHVHRRAKIEIPGEPRNPGGEIVNAHDPVRPGRPAVAGKRWNDHIVALGKMRKTLEPARHAQFAVDHEQRWAAAVAP